MKNFKKFLEKKDIFEQFEKNLYDTKCRGIIVDKHRKKEKEYKDSYVDVDDYLNDMEPEYLLSSAFYWQNSPEGHDYWYNIHMQWLNELIK
jgi:hypothetical protein